MVVNGSDERCICGDECMCGCKWCIGLICVWVVVSGSDQWYIGMMSMCGCMW